MRLTTLFFALILLTGCARKRHTDLPKGMDFEADRKEKKWQHKST